MAKLDEILDELVEDFGVPEDKVTPFRGSSMRTRLEEAEAKAAKVESLEAELNGIRKAPAREKAFKELAKVDWDNLREAEKEAINKFDWEGDEPTAEEVTAFAAKYQFPTSEAVATEEAPAAAGIVNTATSAPGAPAPVESTEERIAKAEREGDFKASFALKTELAREQREAAGI